MFLLHFQVHLHKSINLILHYVLFIPEIAHDGPFGIGCDDGNPNFLVIK